VIVVVGQPLYRVTDEGVSVNGLPARIALAAVSLGRVVQFVGKAGEDPEGDAVVMALARGGVGHVAQLRDAGTTTIIASAPGEDEPDRPDAEAISATDHGAAEGPATQRMALDASDVDLALRYLTDFAVLVLAEPAASEVVAVVADAASWAGARLVVVVGQGQPVPEGLPADVIVLEAPDADADGAFASVVGAFVATLDDGEDPGDAFRSSIRADGWQVSTES